MGKFLFIFSRKSTHLEGYVDFVSMAVDSKVINSLEDGVKNVGEVFKKAETKKIMRTGSK